MEHEGCTTLRQKDDQSETDKHTSKKKDQKTVDDFLILTQANYIYQYSISCNKTIRDLKLINDPIESITITQDKKSIFIASNGIHHYDMLTGQLIKRLNGTEYGLDAINNMIVTYDNQYLIVTQEKYKRFLVMSTRSQKLIRKTKTFLMEKDCLLKCSFDSKFLFIYSPKLEIHGLRTSWTISFSSPWANCKVFVEIFKSNQNAILGYENGDIKMLKWKNNAYAKRSFKSIKDYGRVIRQPVFKICLTNDEQNLILGLKKTVQLFNLNTEKVTKECKLTEVIFDMHQFENGNKIAVFYMKNCVEIIDLKILEILKKTEIVISNDIQPVVLRGVAKMFN